MAAVLGVKKEIPAYDCLLCYDLVFGAFRLLIDQSWRK